MTSVTRRLAKPPSSLTRRYATGIAIVLGTAAFVVLVGFLGLWMIHRG